jgi:protein SPT2
MESDEEEDSELDDFIDDGPDEAEDYSKHIQDIFGYNRNRYANKTFFFSFSTVC